VGRRLTLLGGALLLAGCGGGAGGSATKTSRPCTLVGCSSGVFVTVGDLPPAASTVEICVGADCTKVPVTAGGFALQLVLPHIGGTRPLTVVARVRDVGDRVIRESSLVRRPVRTQPNGPGCRPICYQISAHLARDGRLVPG
jgi:hypothetical protein